MIGTFVTDYNHVNKSCLCRRFLALEFRFDIISFFRAYVFLEERNLKDLREY